MSQTYTYSISGDFPNGKVAPDVLTDQINDSSISSGVLEVINVAVTGPDNCDIIFDQSLSGPDVTTLDGIVAAHDGEPYLDITPGQPGWNLRVEDRNLSDPPGSPVLGTYYIVAAGGTGVWAGYDDAIAGWNGTAWQFQRPSAGLAVWVIDESVVVVYVDGTTKWASYGSPAGTPANVFGTNLHMAESTGVSTTTSASAQNKITLTTATLEAGVYRLEVSYGWNGDSTVTDFIARVQQDGSDLGEWHWQEPKDSGGAFGSTGTAQRHYMTRIYHLSLSAQSYTFTLDYATATAGDEASIWDAYMTLWRMS